MYKCIACSEETMNVFYGREKALFHLLKMSDEQKAIFLFPFVGCELMTRCMKFYSNDFIEILDHEIYYQNNRIRFHEYHLETNNIDTNVLFDYMKRHYKIWCCQEDNGKVVWLKGCQVIENCVK